MVRSHFARITLFINVLTPGFHNVTSVDWSTIEVLVEGGTGLTSPQLISVTVIYLRFISHHLMSPESIIHFTYSHFTSHLYARTMMPMLS
ncbi:hypothetical protein BYT27DRAFT_7191138 [Phlegmacium glaucopus]|nr:hypothetical protein BYT27DRAFT_7191138 [Phlegmacium glaucopus]